MHTNAYKRQTASVAGRTAELIIVARVGRAVDMEMNDSVGGRGWKRVKETSVIKPFRRFHTSFNRLRKRETAYGTGASAFRAHSHDKLSDDCSTKAKTQANKVPNSFQLGSRLDYFALGNTTDR